MTSNGLLPSVEKQPALIPPNNPMIGVSFFSPSFVTRFLYSLNHMKRKPWLEPCFIAVAAAWVTNANKKIQNQSERQSKWKDRFGHWSYKSWVLRKINGHDTAKKKYWLTHGSPLLLFFHPLENNLPLDKPHQNLLSWWYASILPRTACSVQWLLSWRSRLELQWATPRRPPLLDPRQNSCPPLASRFRRVVSLWWRNSTQTEYRLLGCFQPRLVPDHDTS